MHEETWAGLSQNQGWGFPRRWKSFQGVLPWWPVLHVLIILLSHLGQVELVGTCWVGHSWRKQQGLGRLFRGALQGKNLFSSLDAVRDWVRKGSYHTAWAVSCDSSCTCSYAYGHGSAIVPHWTAVLATAFRCVEGHRTPDEALVC